MSETKRIVHDHATSGEQYPPELDNETPAPEPPQLPPEQKGVFENAANAAARYVRDMFIHAHKDKFEEYEHAIQEKAALKSRLDFLRNQITQLAENAEQMANHIRSHIGPDLAVSCVENMRNFSPGEYHRVFQLHSLSHFVAVHADRMLSEIQRRYVDSPKKELADFLKENSAKLKQHGLI